MSIKEIPQKIKALTDSESFIEHIFKALVVILVGVSSFGLGRLSVTSDEPETIPPARQGSSEQASEVNVDHESQLAKESGYVASKNSDKYHLPWCSGAERISDQNKVWFATQEEAQEAGYTPAANCEGL